MQLLTQKGHIETMTLEPKRVAIYTRSTTLLDQAGHNRSLWQLETCRHYCEMSGYTLNPKHIYQDVASGADFRNRPHLHALRRAAQAREFDLVVIATYDRFARNPLPVAMLLEEFKQFGISAVACHQCNDPDENLLHLLLEVQIKMERQQFTTLLGQKRTRLQSHMSETESEALLRQHIAYLVENSTSSEKCVSTTSLPDISVTPIIHGFCLDPSQDGSRSDTP